MDLATKQAFFLFFAIHLPPVEEGEFLLYIMLKCFNASTIALSLSSGHCGCLLSSFLGKLGLGTSSKSVAAVVELPCKQSILLVATHKFFPISIPHFLFTCEIYRLETFMPALCSDTYFFISSYVALVSADVISTSSSSIVTLM